MQAIRSSSSALQVPPFIAPEPSVFAGVKDEYNPLFPNDYEDLIKKRRRERRERERERDRERDERSREKGDERYSWVKLDQFMSAFDNSLINLIGKIRVLQ